MLHMQQSVGNHVSRAVLQRNPPAGQVQAPAPPAADEVVLTSDSKYAAAGYVDWFKNKVKDTVKAWGLAFDANSVSLKTVAIGGKATPVILLKWSATWGAAPSSKSIPFSMAPIDARAAVAGVHALKGWSKLTQSEQGMLDNLLSGETNALSKAARDYLRGKWAALAAKTDVNQAADLKAALSAKDAAPDVVAESLSVGKIGFKLEGPTDEKDHEFNSGKADAQKWTMKCDDGINFPIYAPKTATAGLHNHSVQETADAAATVPKAARSRISRVDLNPKMNPKDPEWAVEYGRPNFHSYMTGGPTGVVSIYPNRTEKAMPDAEYQAGTMSHETGHSWSYQVWGKDKTKGKWVDWKKAMSDDGEVAVSTYARASIAEDVAETIQIYATTKGSPRFDEYRKMVPHRFSMLDADYK